MHAPVFFFLHEEGMAGEGVLVPVFQDEIVALDEDRALEHLVRQRLEPFQGIGGIREDKVETLLRQALTRLGVPYAKVTEEEKQTIINVLRKSKRLQSGIPMRGKGKRKR